MVEREDQSDWIFDVTSKLFSHHEQDGTRTGSVLENENKLRVFSWK